MNKVYKAVLSRPIAASRVFPRAALCLKRNYHFQLLNLKIGFTKAVEVHPESDQLYISQVELDQDGATKQICSGLRRCMPRESLQNRLVVVVDNMKKCKLRGQASEGMLLCGENLSTGDVRLCVPANSDKGLIGRSIVLESNGKNLSSAPTRKIKTKEWEDISSRLRVKEEGRIVYTEEDSQQERHLCVHDENGAIVPIIAKGLPTGSAVK